MVMFDVSKQFDAYDIECTSKRLKARPTRFRVDAGLRPEPAEAATALRKDIEGARDCYRWFTRWCVLKRDQIRQMLDDPTQTFSPADRESWCVSAMRSRTVFEAWKRNADPVKSRRSRRQTLGVPAGCSCPDRLRALRAECTTG